MSTQLSYKEIICCLFGLKLKYYALKLYLFSLWSVGIVLASDK